MRGGVAADEVADEVVDDVLDDVLAPRGSPRRTGLTSSRVGSWRSSGTMTDFAMRYVAL
jgi:hypothetical protein